MSKPLMWVAKYRDGSVLKQYNNGKEQSFDKIPRQGLWYVEIIDDKTAVVVCYEYYQGMMPFYRRRIAMTPGQEPVVMHVLGSRIKIGDDILTQTCFIYESTLRVDIGQFRREGEKKIRADENHHSIAYHPADDSEVTI